MFFQGNRVGPAKFGAFVVPSRAPLEGSWQIAAVARCKCVTAFRVREKSIMTGGVMADTKGSLIVVVVSIS